MASPTETLPTVPKAFDDPGEDWAVLGEAEIRAVWGLVFPMLEGLSRQALTRHAGAGRGAPVHGLEGGC